MELKRVYTYFFFPACRLLIVPYGIETFQAASLIIGLLLLIVPYGIETEATIAAKYTAGGF